MSAWGLFLTPLMTAAAMGDDAAVADAMTAPAVAIEGDLFTDLAAMPDAAMSAASGGADTAVNIGFISSTASNNNSDMNNVSISNTQNGEITDNVITDNSGITTVFNNTGNGVVLQSNVNVNVFLNGGN